jgi:hypothetical protein
MLEPPPHSSPQGFKRSSWCRPVDLLHGHHLLLRLCAWLLIKRHCALMSRAFAAASACCRELYYRHGSPVPTRHKVSELTTSERSGGDDTFAREYRCGCTPISTAQPGSMSVGSDSNSSIEIFRISECTRATLRFESWPPAGAPGCVTCPPVPVDTKISSAWPYASRATRTE